MCRSAEVSVDGGAGCDWMSLLARCGSIALRADATGQAHRWECGLRADVAGPAGCDRPALTGRCSGPRPQALLLWISVVAGSAELGR